MGLLDNNSATSSTNNANNATKARKRATVSFKLIPHFFSLGHRITSLHVTPKKAMHFTLAASWSVIDRLQCLRVGQWWPACLAGWTDGWCEITIEQMTRCRGGDAEVKVCRRKSIAPIHLTTTPTTLMIIKCMQSVGLVVGIVTLLHTSCQIGGSSWFILPSSSSSSSPSFTYFTLGSL